MTHRGRSCDHSCAHEQAIEIFGEAFLAGLLPGELEGLALAVLAQHASKGKMLFHCVEFLSRATKNIHTRQGAAVTADMTSLRHRLTRSARRPPEQVAEGIGRHGPRQPVGRRERPQDPLLGGDRQAAVAGRLQEPWTGPW